MPPGLSPQTDNQREERERGKLESVPLTLSLYASVFALAEDSWTEDQYESDSSLTMEGVVKKGVGWRCGHELSSAWVEALRSVVGLGAGLGTGETVNQEVLY